MLQIRASGDEIIERRFGLDKGQMHDPARGVVDENEQGALRATILKPPMLGAIDLNEFADAVAPMPRLVNRFETLPAIFPEPFSQHPTPHCFYAQTQSVTFRKLFGRQRRTKV